MDRYNILRAMMDFVADNYEVTGANMQNYSGEVEVRGFCDENKICIKVSIEEEEEADENAQ